MKLTLLMTALLILGSCDSKPTANGRTPVTPSPDNSTVTSPGKLPVTGYEVVASYKHDGDAFTQGLFYRDGFLYESTGHYGESTLRKVDYKTGKAIQKHRVPKDFFAEGIAVVGNEIYQLTWQSGVGFVYSIDGFKLLREFRYTGQGWGLTFDGTNLYHSDGSQVIRVVDPKTYRTLRLISVNNENGKPLTKLNELEWVKGEIWANIWHSEEIGKPNHIARIDPTTGKLLGWINLSGISPKDTDRDDENTMNGIAYDPEGDRIFVTGKNWKNLYEIKLLE
ncbi:MAG: glutaminyl-peptide cyclotransferase [Acidobacteriota bacterium]|nr:glutaminyl-peptide cyclotransferase [Acidobacteriota bacterium]MDH3528298.1 glutaminyl-peptide cyclotransferase [Acidobacteriota bacterium]